ncbi:MAG: Pyruvate formate-lyase 1-activating enzyme [candidate division WS6 bacterium GW2011_GWF2_39_15]|uniref:Pyruvate formate-lyase-activating enzyme n=1 Tax=candidate division WS6 bacterium GW2011_GWF2_39_15 TaxID=1619100 RepID=A0A0G0QWW8_9BACT|nr:MAG: Pyruvate formate-lyase 1-activating enzyme [candidate division WS6 bacterium GW2011_GWF2_39_15]
MVTGKIHSIESFGTLDGPGVRTVVFMQGCPNHCVYCHNVDCAIPKGGKEYTVQDLTAEVLKNKEYWKPFQDDTPKGGVTFSGGDPLYQPDFLLECVQNLKKEGIHIVIDTSAVSAFEKIDSLVEFVDLWMISIKHMDEDSHKELVGKGNAEILENIKELDRRISNTGKKIRIRFVIIPGLTDSEEHIKKLGTYIKGLRNLERVELLPYSTIGRHKWIELFGRYRLEGIPEATNEDVTRTKQILTSYTNKF